MTLDARLAAMRAELIAAAGRDTFWRRLGARLVTLEADRAVLELPPAASRCNLAGVVHGGESAAMLDQACGLAANAVETGDWVTGKAELIYHAPLPGDQPLIVEARAVMREGRRAVVEGRVRTADMEEPRVAARMIFIQLNAKQG